MKTSTSKENIFEDLSGVASTSSSRNPYDALISSCGNDQRRIQSHYTTHRTTRNAQQKERMLDSSFRGFNIDPVLFKLCNPDQYPDFVDERYCLVFWARPPEALKVLIGRVQGMLRGVLEGLWLMPAECLHMTALEIAHSRTDEDIDTLVQQLRPSIPKITDFPPTHRARLIKPMLSFDAAAIAFSFVPAAGEALSASPSPSDAARTEPDDSYTYHHLRRSLYDLCTATGVDIASRYTVPSAHLTIARFVTQTNIRFSTPNDDAVVNIDPEKVEKLLGKIEEINAWLREEYWPKEGRVREGGEWIVGEEVGLDCRRGTLWYGGGETVRLGEGFGR